MKKYLFLFGAIAVALATISCSDDDDVVPSNSKVTDNFMTMYPNAQDISWGRALGYWVAEFNNVEPLLQTDCTAWFDNDGEWYLTDTDLPPTALPEAVQNAFEIGDYADWFIDEIDMVERYNSQAVYVIEVDNDQAAEDAEIDLYYTPDGTLIKSEEAGSSLDYRPVVLAEATKSYLSQNYPEATIINLSSQIGLTEVDILDGQTFRALFFSKTGEWTLTESHITVAELPDSVMQTIAQSQYAAWEIQQVEMIQTADQLYYQIVLADNTNQTTLKILADGQIL